MGSLMLDGPLNGCWETRVMFEVLLLVWLIVEGQLQRWWRRRAESPGVGRFVFTDQRQSLATRTWTSPAAASLFLFANVARSDRLESLAALSLVGARWLSLAFGGEALFILRVAGIYRRRHLRQTRGGGSAHLY